MLAILVGTAGYLIRPIRDIEIRLPDVDTAEAEGA